MYDWQKNRIQSAIKGENPTVIHEFPHSFAVIGDTQFLEGYCVLLPKKEVNNLNELSLEERKAFLLEMSLLGDVIQKVCKPRRLNYEILGNTDEFLHAHIFPRYEWEEQAYKKKPVWLYPIESWTSEAFFYQQEKYQETRMNLEKELKNL